MLLLLLSIYCTLCCMVYGLPEPSDGQQNAKTNSFGMLGRSDWADLPRSSSLWSYRDTEAWKEIYPTCGGQRQSPINIEPRESELKTYSKFSFHNYDDVIQRLTLPTLCRKDYHEQRIPYVTGGGLEGRWNFYRFHLHWGNDSTRGSEHIIQSKGYPAELHLVHYNTKYDSFEIASEKEDGLAVLAVLTKIGDRDNEFLKPVVDQLRHVANENAVSLRKLLPSRTTSFYRYSGSLTTPKCNEVFTWTVFDTLISVSENQIERFRNLFDLHGQRIVDNFRPPMPLSGRTVTYRSAPGCKTPGQWPNTSNLLQEHQEYQSCLRQYQLTAFLSKIDVIDIGVFIETIVNLHKSELS